MRSMKKLFWGAIFMALIGLNLYPSFDRMGVRAEYWRCGLPIKWLIVSYGGEPPGHYDFTIDYSALLIVFVFWGLILLGLARFLKSKKTIK